MSTFNKYPVLSTSERLTNAIKWIAVGFKSVIEDWRFIYSNMKKQKIHLLLPFTSLNVFQANIYIAYAINSVNLIEILNRLTTNQ